MPIEFRQRYIGPVPQRCANLLRAMDCPSDAIENRRRTVDTRLLAGTAVVHADMVIWHRDEPVAAAALQLIAVLHAVPQISVRLADLSDAHRTMLRHWLHFWSRYRETLLDGNFIPSEHCSGWVHIRCADAQRCIDIVHADRPCRWQPTDPSQRLIVNGTRRDGVVVVGPHPAGTLVIYDTTGREVQRSAVHAASPQSTCQHLAIPAAGYAMFQVGDA